MPRLGSLSVLVVSWNGREHLELCLPALVGQRDCGCAVEILLLDNGSRDGSAEWAAQRFPSIRVVRSEENLGFAAGNNRLAGEATGEAVVLVNNDTLPEPGWLAALANAYRSSPDDVAAIAGTIVDWEGAQLDFGRGVVTFDGHALALDQGRPLAGARLPRADEELFFGCGGNLLVRRSSFLEAGGFDPRYFAYFEDVDLGWRLWAGGERIVACPDAIVRHRLSATSSRLGNRRRGALYERNALWTLAKNLDGELRPRLLNAALLTFLSRLEAMLAEESPTAELLLRGPGRGAARQRENEALGAKVRRLGVRGSLQRGTARALRSTAKRLTGERGERLEIVGDRPLAQLAALGGFLAELDGVEGERERLASRRRRGDRELFERFPLWIVPTYPGDERLFASRGFAAWLPDDLRFERARLEEIVARE